MSAGPEPGAPGSGVQHVLIRYSGDIGTKARITRRHFVKRLIGNLRDALRSEGLPPEVHATRDRIFAQLPAGESGEVLSRVFGVQSLSLVERHPASSLAQVVERGRALFAESVRGRRFAVRARRVGDRSRVPLRSRDVERELGAALLPLAERVDLDHPEVTAHVELFEGEAFFFAESLPGPGGLPLGVEGRAIALISGGFDSAVAAWQLLKRGVALDYVFCNLGGVTHLHGTLRVVKVLADRWSYGDRPRLHAIDFGPVVQELQARTSSRYWQVLLKRLMLRAADRIADERGALALVTGEAIGQVSSQTLHNLAAISPASQRTILRPLAGFNKDEIIALAERIGTAELSKVVQEYCDLVPRRPATRAALETVAEEEACMDLSRIAAAVDAREVLELRSLDVDKLDLPELETSHVPEGATVIDLRSAAEYATWHHEGALRLDFARALAAYPSFDPGGVYVLYCEFGLKSAHLAELMRREGLEAFHFKGGTAALKRLAGA